MPGYASNESFELLFWRITAIATHRIITTHALFPALDSLNGRTGALQQIGSAVVIRDDTVMLP